MDSAAPKNRGAEGSTAAVHCCSPAYHVCITFASALAEITAVLRQNGQVVFSALLHWIVPEANIDTY
jgi:hypothetical protein